jgi:transcriptional regulator with XRE-family HTH domain
VSAEFAALVEEAAAQRRKLAAATLQTFGARVKRKREALAWSQDELGDMVGLTRSSIANIEAGRQDTPLSQAAVLAAALGEPLGALVGDRA